MTFGTSEDKGRFAFDQEFWKFLEGERMEQTFSGISFRNFGCTSRGWTKIPEIRRLRVVPDSLSPSCVTRKKMAAWISGFHADIFFRVTHDGLSERGTTRSLGNIRNNRKIKYHSTIPARL